MAFCLISLPLFPCRANRNLGPRPQGAAVQIQQGKTRQKGTLASLAITGSSLKLADPTGEGHRARRKGWMRELLQFAPTAWASLLLGGDEQSPSLERTTKQSLPSSLGSCELWLPAGGEVKQLCPPSPAPPWPPLLAPGASVLPSGVLGPHPVSLHHTNNLLITKGSQVSPCFSFGITRAHFPTCGDPCPSRVLPPNSLLAPGLFCPSLWLPPLDQAATSLVSSLYMSGLQK